MLTTVLFLLALFGMAVLYTTVGHAGASGYLLVMTLASVAPPVLKPAALLMNIAVASFALLRYQQKQLIPWRLVLPLVAGSIPAALLGGYFTLPEQWYSLALGLILLFSAVRMWLAKSTEEQEQTKTVPLGQSLAVGGVLGLLSGLTGTGGGIFLSPWVLWQRWTTTRQASGLCTAFILLNSVAGLTGYLLKNSLNVLPANYPLWVIVALLGAVVGTSLGRSKLSNPAIRRVLALVLALAGVKLILKFAQWCWTTQA